MIISPRKPLSYESYIIIILSRCKHKFKEEVERVKKFRFISHKPDVVLQMVLHKKWEIMLRIS